MSRRRLIFSPFSPFSPFSLSQRLASLDLPSGAFVRHRVSNKATARSCLSLGETSRDCTTRRYVSSSSSSDERNESREPLDSIHSRSRRQHSLKDGTLKYRFKKGIPTVGVVTGLYQDTDHVEILGLLGYDFLWADAEHSSASPSDIARLILGAERRGMPTLVRIGYGYQNIIGHAQKYLVAGAQGILLPQCESREEVEQIVDAVKFPPVGKRGLAGERWNNWGITGADDQTSLAERVEESNRNSIVGIVVESQKGLARLDEMLEVSELDFVFVAPTDLSADLGLHGQIRHPRVLELVEEAGQRIQAAGKAAGMLALSPQDYSYWRKRGFTVLCCVAQNLFIDGARGMMKSISDLEDDEKHE
jgi:4-hydroxy-2-oxoheptanedioate aldolase